MYKEYAKHFQSEMDCPPINHSQFQLLKLLGSGGFSNVYKGLELATGKIFAIKMFPLVQESSVDVSYEDEDYTSSESASSISSITSTRRRSDSTLKEVMEQEGFILRGLKHRNLIQLVQFTVDWDDQPFLVLEYANGGDVYDRLSKFNRFPERLAARTMKQVLAGVEYIHRQGIVHRDLKPENLLYKTKQMDSIILISDFGLSYIECENPMSTPCGTVDYSAPELLKNRVYGRSDEDYIPHEYGEEVDDWSIGVICFVLLAGYPPFYSHDDNIEEIEDKILKGDYTFHFPYWNNISEYAKDFVVSLLQVDPYKRLYTHEAYEHPWLSLDFDNLDIPKVELSESEQLEYYGEDKNFDSTSDE